MARTYASEPAYRRTSQRSSSTAQAARVRRLSPIEMFILAVIAALIIASPFATRQHANLSVPMRSVQVQAGDSLWSIAQEHPIPGTSTAQAVEIIAARNAIKSGTVSPGQTIIVPSKQSEDRLAMR